MGYNSPEWAIAYHGAIFHNNVLSGVYITNGPAACKYQSEHSDAEVIVVDTLEQLKIYMGLLPELTRIKAVIAWGDFVIPEDIAKDSRVYNFKQFLDLGKSIPDSVIETTMAKQRPGHCVVLVYTSGTTGNPKGVMLSHDNLLFSMASCTGDVLESVPEEKMMKVEDQRMVSYLPLSHIAGL